MNKFYSERQELSKISKKHLNKRMRKKLLTECRAKWSIEEEKRNYPFKFGVVGVADLDDDYID